MKIQVLLACITAVLGYITTASAQIQRPTKAFNYFITAADVIVDGGKLGTELTPEALEQWIKDNRESLTLVRQGLTYEYYPADLNLDQPRFRGKWRWLGLLLVADGDAKAARGDWNAAANAYVDAIKFGSEVTRGAPVIDLLTGHFIQALGRRKLAESLVQLDATAAQEATRRLEIVVLSQPVFTDVLRSEAWLSERIFREGILADAEPQFKEEALHHYDELWVKKIVLVEQFSSFNMRAMAFGIPTGPWRVLTQEEEPDEQFKIPVPDLKNAKPTDVAQTSFDVVQPLMGRVYFSDTINRQHNQLSLAALALQAYRAAHNKYPETLLQLMPDYLEKAPSDLFEMDETLRYKRDGEEYLLYSVGPDGRNDDGTPIHNPDKTGREEYSVRLAGTDAKGDFVFGVNN